MLDWRTVVPIGKVPPAVVVSLQRAADDAWGALPHDARLLLAAKRPRLYVATDSSVFRRQPNTQAYAAHQGHVMFRAAFVQRLSVPALDALVLHELAHVVVAAVGGRRSDEAAASALAAWWGADEERLRREARDPLQHGAGT